MAFWSTGNQKCSLLDGRRPHKVGFPLSKLEVNTSEILSMNAFPSSGKASHNMLLILWDGRICPIEAEQKLDGAAVEFRACLIILRCFVMLLLFSSLFAACVQLSLPNPLAFSCLFKKRERKNSSFLWILWKRAWQALAHLSTKTSFFVLFWGFALLFFFFCFLGSTRTCNVWTSACAFWAWARWSWSNEYWTSEMLLWECEQQGSAINQTK